MASTPFVATESDGSQWVSLEDYKKAIKLHCWGPVSESLPSDGVQVLTVRTVAGQDVLGLAWYDYDHQTWRFAGGNRVCRNVTKWAPIPDGWQA